MYADGMYTRNPSFMTDDIDGQISIMDYMGDMTIEKDGRMHPAPDWYHKKRCERCQYWNISPTQPADGWGIYGACTSYRHKGHEVSKTSYCDDYIEVSL